MQTALERLIELAESLSPTGTIGDGMVAQLQDAAKRARDEKGRAYSDRLDEARKRLEAEVALNRLRRAVRMGPEHGDRSGVMAQALEQADQVLDAINDPPAPIPMLLHCPACGRQHIDQATAEWSNPPHRSHLCGGCGCIWRPADVATVGVAAIETRGKADHWPIPDEQPDAVCYEAPSYDELERRRAARDDWPPLVDDDCR